MLQKKIRCVNIEYKREKNGHTTVYFKIGCTEEMNTVHINKREFAMYIFQRDTWLTPSILASLAPVEGLIFAKFLIV